ncbi:MAG: hypothetical protein V5B39_21120 [Accumulibacter sp.]|uniref:hypothetical protein n=1 Tax=Accumulibacter sp. TaxID=2053492 RepID=UPI002FC31FA1
MNATPEVDRMVDDFFAHALVRDANETVIAARITVGEFNWVSYGMKPPTVPPDLCGLIARIRQHADWSSVSNRIRLQWRERLGPIAQKNTAESYEKRVACLAPIDRLKLDACNPTSHPTEATLVAKWYLDGTNDTPHDHEYARHLLLEAADCGNAEAAYLLATATITGETVDSPRKAVAGFIIEDARLRDEFRTQARAARFFKVFQDENAARRYEDFTDTPVDYLREQLESDLQCRTSDDDEADPSAARAGDPDAQWRLAMCLLHQADCIERHSELCAKDEMTRRRRDALKAEARRWLEQASPALSWAKHQLAMRFAEPGEERFTLLHMAAVPTGEVSPCPLALVPLATDFYMNPASTYHDISKGLSCLREYLGQYESVSRDLERITRDAHIGIDEASHFGVWEEDAQAALCLADYVKVYPQDARGPEAYIWYSAVAANIRNAAYAALMAGLLELRGQGCEKNLIRAKKLFDLARKSSPGNPRDVRAVKYADALYRLGFELPGHGRLAVDLLFELLFELAKESELKGDPDCAITPADIADLVTRNPNLEDYYYCQIRDDSRSRRKAIRGASGPYGEFALFPDIAEGLIWALQSQETIPREALGKLWDDTSSMIEDYVWVRLELSSRLVPSTGINDAARRIKRVIDLADRCLDHGGSEDLDMNGFAAVQDLRAKALRTASIIACQLAEEHAREDERRQMISFLSHTLVNVTVGTSRMLREIMAELAAVRDPAHVAALAVRLAPTATRASVVESLVKVFKLYTSDPDALRKDWESEQGGDHSVAQTVVLALQMTLLRFCRMPEFKSARRRLLPDVQYDTLTAELISEIMPLEGSSAAQLEQLAAWVERRMPFLRLSLAGAEDLRVMEDGARHIVIFALVGEFLTNALKFTGTGGAISLSVTRTDTGLELACRNPVDTEMPRPLLSGKTGLDFVRKVCQLVAARFDEPAVDGGAFSVHAVLPIQ